MKTLLLLLVLICPVVCYSQDVQVELKSLTDLIGKDAGDITTAFSDSEWKFLNYKSVNKSGSIKEFTYGYKLKITNKKPKATAWLDFTIKNGSIVDVRYQIQRGNYFSDMVNDIIKSGAVKIETTTDNGTIRVDYGDNQLIFNAVTMPGINQYGTPYLIEIQDRSYYLNRKK